MKIPVLVALLLSTVACLSQDLTIPPKKYTDSIDTSLKPKRLNEAYPLSDQTNTRGWKMDKQLSDEFDRKKLNTKRWHPNNPSWKGRMPTYFHGSNVSLDGNELIFKINQHGNDSLPEGYTHTAGFIKSKERILYGYFESEMKLMDAPWVSGFWLTFGDSEWWTEIDICENDPGVERNRNDLNSNVHVFRAPPEKGDVKEHFSITKRFFYPEELQKDYHVWGLEWNKEVIRFYIDGIMFREQENTHWHQPLTINFNNESNKWFGALPDERTDKEFRVKYLRVWRYKD